MGNKDDRKLTISSSHHRKRKRQKNDNNKDKNGKENNHCIEIFIAPAVVEHPPENNNKGNITTQCLLRGISYRCNIPTTNQFQLCGQVKDEGANEGGFQYHIHYPYSYRGIGLDDGGF